MEIFDSGKSGFLSVDFYIRFLFTRSTIILTKLPIHSDKNDYLGTTGNLMIANIKEDLVSLNTNN